MGGGGGVVRSVCQIIFEAFLNRIFSSFWISTIQVERFIMHLLQISPDNRGMVTLCDIKSL